MSFLLRYAPRNEVTADFLRNHQNLGIEFAKQETNARRAKTEE